MSQIPQSAENPTDDRNVESPENSPEAESHDSKSVSKREINDAPEGELSKFPFSIGVLIFTIVVFIAFVLCLAGMSIGMMDSRTSKSCMSIWGYKPKCLGSWFVHMDWETFAPGNTSCKKGDSLMQGAQAFSVMCIIGGMLTVAVAILELLHFAELAVVACIISCINTVATLVTWSTMLAMYWSNLCGAGVYADEYRIGNGLILFITAWCLQMVGNIVLIFEVYTGNSK